LETRWWEGSKTGGDGEKVTPEEYWDSVRPSWRPDTLRVANWEYSTISGLVELGEDDQAKRRTQ